MEFCPKSTPLFAYLYWLLGNMRLTLYFWPILAEFFISPGNMFIRTVFLRNNSIFLKKCKNGVKNGVFAQNVSLFCLFLLILGQNEIDPFFLADFGRIFYSSRKYIYSNCLSTKQLNLKKNVKMAQKWSFAQNVPLFLPIFTDFWAKWDWIVYSSRKYVYSNCLSTKQLDFFEKM